MNFSAFLTTIATLFILLGVGYFCGKRGIIDSAASKNLSTLIVTIGQPLLIISSVLKIKYSPDNIKLGLTTLLLCTCLFLFSAAAAFVACLKVKSFDERKIMEFSMVFGNTGFIGIPILQSLLGDVGAFMASFNMVVFNTLVWILGIGILGRGRDDIHLTLKRALINKGTVPSLIGLSIFIIPAFAPSFEMPEIIMSSLGYISSLCTPISMLIIGALLSTQKFSQIFGTGRVYYVCAFKLVVIPLLVGVLTNLLGFSDLFVIFSVALCSMPCATMVSMLAKMYDISPEFSAIGVGTSSLLSIATMPTVIFIAQKMLEVW